MAISEVLRQKVIEDLLRVPGVARCWPTWQDSYRSIAGNPPTPGSLVNDLGANLRTVFVTTSTAGRSQDQLSGGGTAWEALICWYLNLCLIGTRAVVVKKKSNLPTPLRDALTLSYGTSQTNTESDLVAVTFPANDELDGFAGPYSGRKREAIDQLLAHMMGQLEACVIQCKTNWNDNAQIPMLWDLVYSARGFSANGVAIGRNSHSIHSLRRFAYAFVTLPSNPPDCFTPNSMAVLRVSKLSGGNYWGYPRRNGVAGAISDIFARNFTSSTQVPGQPWHNHLGNELPGLASRYSYFNY